MGRNSDWSPITWGDPTPGEPDVVMSMGRSYVDVADAIKDAASTLRNLAADEEDNIGEAIEKFVERADQVADDIARAEERYRATGEAMKTYSPALATAQGTADGALVAYRNSDAEEPMFGDSPELKTAKSAVDGAEGSRDSAARTAAGAIDDILDSGDLKDGFWDNCGDFVKALQKIASTVAAVCGVAALLVGWIPVIGQALAAVLGAIALVATVVSLACNILMLMNGEGSWGSLALDVISLATFGLGRAATAAVKGTAAGVRGGTRVAATAVSRSRTPIARLLGSQAAANTTRRAGRRLVDASMAYRSNGILRNAASAQRGVFSEAGAGARTLWANRGNLPAITQMSVDTLTDVRNLPRAVFGDDVANLANTLRNTDSRVLGHADALPHIVYNGGAAGIAGVSQALDLKLNTDSLRGD